MTRSETLAFNAGINAVLDLAARTAAAMGPRLIDKPTRFNFAVGALEALASEGRALLIELPPEPTVPVAGVPQSPSGHSGGASATMEAS